MAWKHLPATKWDKNVYISSRHRKASRRHQQNVSANCLTDKDHPQAISCKPIYHSQLVICNFWSHSAKPAWRLQKKNDMANFAEQKKRCTRRRWSRTEYFFFLSVDFLFLKAVFQRKVWACEIYLRGLRPCFLHGGALVHFWTATNVTSRRNWPIRTITRV